MNYKMYKIHHSRGKSDTNFYQEQAVLNGAYSGLKVLRVSIVNDLTYTSISNKKRQRRISIKNNSKDSKKSKFQNVNNVSNTSNISNDSNSDESNGDRISTLIERVFLFKKELDSYFFDNRLNLMKFHLNNISAIIIKNISDLQDEIIKDCPILKNSHIIKILGNFSEIISTFIETKPQDLYREIKDAILNQWEKNRIKIKELYEKIEKNCNISVESEKDDTAFSMDNYEIYRGISDEMRKDSNTTSNSLNISSKKNTEFEENIKKLKKIEPNTLYYLIKRKKEIMNFVLSVTQGILFSISRLYYNMDYYSIIISSLAFKLFYAIMYYIDSNKDKKENLTEYEKIKQKKVFHIINHIIRLALSFNTNIEKEEIALEKSGLNSLSKYILNNFTQIASKCQGLVIPKIIPKFKEPSLYQINYKTKYYKCYLQRYKKYSDNSLLRIFMLFYNSKMIFWKSIMIVAKPKDDIKNFICRTCEKKIPLDNIFLHLGCCKEQQSFYDKMKGFKLKIQNYITHLDILLAKSNINMTPVNRKLFGKGGHLNIIINKIYGCENDDDGINFIKKLIKVYTYEKNKPNDYYEKKPEDIPYIVSMSYFSLMVFLLNKISLETDQDLSEILGGLFCTLLQIFMNIQFLLYIKNSKTKNIMMKNRKNILNSNSNLTEIENKNINNTTNDVNNKNLKINNDNDSDDEDFFNPQLNFKSVIQKYKLKLSVNNMMFINNSVNNSKSKTNDRTRTNSHTNLSQYISNNNSNQENNKTDFFQQKSFSTINSKKKKPLQRIIQNASSQKLNDILSSFDSIQHLFGKKNYKNKYKKRSHSNHNTLNVNLNLNNKSYLKLNTFNYRPMGIRSINMTRNNSSSNIFLEQKKENFNPKKNTDNQSNDSSFALDGNNSNSGTNIINTSSMLMESESSGEFDPIINKSNLSRVDSNLSRVDSCLSRIDSNIHRIDSDISQVDSLENNTNKIEDDNNQNKIKFILNNNQNFELGYRGEQPKKNFNKLSLFGYNSSTKKSPEKKNNQIEKKPTLFKTNNKDKEIKQINSSDDSDSSDLVDNSSDSSSGQNILVHEFEEEEENNDNKNNNEKNKEKKSIKKKEKAKKYDNDFFFNKNNKKEDENNNNENDNNNIIIHSSIDTSESKDDDDFYHYNKQIPTKDIEKILPNMVYVRKGSLNNINYDQIADLFNKLMEEIEKKNTNLDKNYSKNNNSFFNDSISKDKDFFDKSRFVSEIKSNSINNSINISSIKTKDFNDNENIMKNNDENEKKVSRFKLILPIAKGGYGSVGLYKNLATSDTYAIKTVDINNMKEKNLSSSLKNEQNILKEINNDYVVNSYYIFQDTKNYYFVMEYLPGGDVYTLLSKNNLPKKTIQLIVAETILAVNYLHSICIIHHDIKPENILISLKGHFKLSDFGLSKTLQEDNEYDVVKNLKNFVEFNKFPINFNLGNDENENKDAVGTLNYMAPELFTDKYPHGSGIDYWAIGVLIFDLFSYSLPFEANGQEEVRNNIINININWSKLINDDVKKIYGNIDAPVDLIKKFLKENPADRWGDKNLEEIKKHKFFEGFNWNDVQNIKNDTIKEYVKQRVKENNNKIKEINLKNKIKKEKGDKNDKDNNKTEDGYPSIIEINLTENEEKDFFTERYDNLNKKNAELIKKKIAKEVNFKENISDLLLFDLE